MCLCAATGLVYRNCNNYFLGGAMQLDHSLFLKVSPDRTNELLKSSNTYLHAFFALIWTTIFAVKLSFLAFFKKLKNKHEEEKKLLCVQVFLYPPSLGATRPYLGLEKVASRKSVMTFSTLIG